MAYTLLHDGDPSIESFRGVFMKMRLALGTTAFGINEVSRRDRPRGRRLPARGRPGHPAVAGPDGLRFIVVGAQPKPAYDGRPSL